MARSSNSSGSIYQLADGAWRGSIIVGYTNTGAVQRLYRRGPTRAAVAKKLRALANERDSGRTDWTKPPSAREWMAHWLENIARPTIAPSTYSAYRVATNRFIAHLPPTLSLTDIRPETLEGWYAELADQGHNPGNIDVHHRVITTALTTAHRRGRIPTNPSLQVTPPKGERPDPNPLTLQEAQALLSAISASRAGVRWWLAILYGWRQSEILGLEWSAVDLAGGTITRRNALAYRPHLGYVVRTPKSKAAKATYPLPPALVTMLREWRTQQARERLLAGPGWVQVALPTETGSGQYSDPIVRDLVFTHPDGAHLPRKYDWEAWHRMLKAAGLPARRLHDARHTASNLMVAAGVHPRVHQHLMGHSKASTSLDVYTNVPVEATKDAVTALLSLLTGTPEAGAAAGE